MTGKIYYVDEEHLDGCEHLPYTPISTGYYRVTEDEVDIWVVAEKYDRLYQPYMSGLGLLHQGDTAVHIKTLESDPNYLVGVYEDSLLLSWTTANRSIKELSDENIIYIRDESPSRLKFIVGSLFNEWFDERLGVELNDLHGFNSIQVLESIFNNFGGYMLTNDHTKLVDVMLEDAIAQFPDPNAITVYAHCMSDLGRVKEACKLIKDKCSNDDLDRCGGFVKSLVK